MPKFKDAQGREWSFEYTGFEAREIQLAGVPVVTEEEVQRAIDDTGYLAEVLWVILEKKAGEREINRESFMRGIKGDAAQEAVDAFVEAYADFSPTKVGQAMKTHYAKVKQVRNQSIDALLSGQLTNDSGESSTVSPDSPG